MIVFSCVGFVFFFFGINWSLSVGCFVHPSLPISLYLTSTTFSWWGRPSWNRLISLTPIIMRGGNGLPPRLVLFAIGSFFTEPGLWRVRCLLLEYHPFKCQSTWGTTGTAPYALVELKQGPNFPNLWRGYLPQKLSTLNLNIPTKQDKEKENQSQFSSQFSEGCYLRQLLKTTCLLSSHVGQVERWKDISSVEYVNVAWSMTDVVGALFQAQTSQAWASSTFGEYRCGSVNW